MQVLLHSFIGSLLDSDSVVVDLGAYKGEFSEYITKRFGCKVFAVEPVPELFRGIKTDRKFQYCINGDGRECELYMEKCATLYGSGNKIKAEGRTLKQFLSEAGISHIDLLKVDIEGAEVELFESIEKETLSNINQITVEFHDFLWSELHDRVEMIKEKIIANGFYCIQFSLNNGDILFVRRNLIPRYVYLWLKYVVKWVKGAIRRIKKR